MKPKPAIPKGWIWLYWLNPASYSLYGLTASQLGDVDSLTEIPGGQVSWRPPPAACPLRRP